MSDDVKAAVERLLKAADERDYDALVAAMTEDCVFESVGPRPDGNRYVGNEAIAKFYCDMGADAKFETEDLLYSDDRCTYLWKFDWVNNGERIINRGVDVMRVRDGKVCEKLAYTKLP